ncbi:MAG: hypothetical protein HW412_1610 [Bacteroidetes bacterium]|nr:hypothetical protein [Bacteroidota bacterium]
MSCDGPELIVYEFHFVELSREISLNNLPDNCLCLIEDKIVVHADVLAADLVVSFGEEVKALSPYAKQFQLAVGMHLRVIGIDVVGSSFDEI